VLNNAIQPLQMFSDVYLDTPADLFAVVDRARGRRENLAGA
jgi:hypothetical protein